MLGIKNFLSIFFLLAWAAGEAPRLWWKETVPVRPMDAAAGLIVVMDLLGVIRRIRRIRRGKVILNIGLIIAVLAESWILGPYAVRILVYGWLIWRGRDVFGEVRKWIRPAMAAFLILGLGQYAFLPDTRFLLQYGWDEHYYRLIGTVLDPNYFGVMAGMMGLYFIDKWKNGKMEKWKIRLLVLLSLATLVLTYSRASYLSSIAGVLVWMSWKKLNFRLLTIFSIAVLLSIGIYLAAPKPGGEGVNLMRTSSIEQRLVSWNQAIEVWKQHPWLGTGFKNYGVRRGEYGVGNAPSNSWLLIFEATGILGSVGVMMGVIWVIREIRGDGLWMAIAIMVGVHAVFNNTLFYPPVLGLLALLRIRSLR